MQRCVCLATTRVVAEDASLLHHDMSPRNLSTKSNQFDRKLKNFASKKKTYHGVSRLIKKNHRALKGRLMVQDYSDEGRSAGLRTAVGPS